MYRYVIALCFLLMTGICLAECTVTSIDKNSKQEILDALQCVNGELDNIEAEIDNAKETALRISREVENLTAEERICENQKAVAARSGNPVDKQLASECTELFHIRQSKLSEIMEEYQKLKSNFQILQDTKTKLGIKKSNLELLFNNIAK